MDAKTEGAGRVTSRFIPLTRQAVIADLCADPAHHGEHEAFAALALRLQRHRGIAYRRLARRMRELYLPFSPDRDTVRVLTFTPEERQAMETELAGLTRRLLDRANYAPIDTDALNAILNRQTPYSLRIAVDLGEYDALALSARETYTKRHSVRRPETLYLLKAESEERVYRRLFVFLKLKPDEPRAREIADASGIPFDKALKQVRRKRRNLPPSVSSDYIYMKVFKDLPEHDLQILFPLRTVQFRPFDKIKFFATAGGGTLFGIFSTTGKLLAATSPFAMLGALTAFVGLLARQITSFFNHRTRYMMELAQKLFFHNLANNRAALTLLLDRAEEEDVKEDIIALYFNAGAVVRESELSACKARIDAMVLERYGIAIDFELADAVGRLEADGAVERGEGALRFATLEEAAALYGALLERNDRAEWAGVCEGAERTEALEA
ncbi:DUF3754 domain-containing protein [Gymnodinialimonas sp.]